MPTSEAEAQAVPTSLKGAVEELYAITSNPDGRCVDEDRYRLLVRRLNAELIMEIGTFARKLPAPKPSRY